MQEVLQLLHQANGLLLRIKLLGLFQTVELILFSVHQREVKKGFFVSSLWYCNGDTLQVDINLLGQDNLLRIAVEPLPHLHNTQLEEFLVCLVEFLLIFEGETLVDRAVRDVDIVDESDLLIVGDGEDIDVVNGMADHLAFRYKLVDEQVTAFDFLGFLEA